MCTLIHFSYSCGWLVAKEDLKETGITAILSLSPDGRSMSSPSGQGSSPSPSAEPHRLLNWLRRQRSHEHSMCLDVTLRTCVVVRKFLDAILGEGGVTQRPLGDASAGKMGPRSRLQNNMNISQPQASVTDDNCGRTPSRNDCQDNGNSRYGSKAIQ